VKWSHVEHLQDLLEKVKKVSHFLVPCNSSFWARSSCHEVALQEKFNYEALVHRAPKKGLLLLGEQVLTIIYLV
jgi:hypothetical protein